MHTPGPRCCTTNGNRPRQSDDKCELARGVLGITNG